MEGHMTKKKALRIGGLFALGLVVLGGWMYTQIKPTEKGNPFAVRWQEDRPLGDVLTELEMKKVIRNAGVAGLASKILGVPNRVASGSYRFTPGQSLKSVIATLRNPLVQMLRLPETNWAARTANILEKNEVCTAQEYMDLVQNPRQFQSLVSFPLPETTLEGYLYPDTYDLPPLLGARAVVQRQLMQFETKVWKGLGQPQDLNDLIILGSLIQLEAGTDPDRFTISGVIANRLKKGMYLQIDAGILYAIQKFRRLTFKDYREVKSPYNLYLNKGLPPGPICSPSAISVEAAMKPEKHDFLYYVALPDRTSIFARNYEEHKANIARRKAAIAEQKK